MIKEMKGLRFGRLLVVDFAFASKGRAWWKCVCACGARKTISGMHLRCGDIKSCGCAQYKETAKRFTKHGKCNTRTFRVWVAMRFRCNSPKSPIYRHYGGRGIRVCARWSKFENFLKDMGERPTGLELDRINNDGDYKPSNCRWTTRKEQARNTRFNHLLKFRGKTQCVEAWCAELRIPRGVMMRKVKSGELKMKEVK